MMKYSILALVLFLLASYGVLLLNVTSTTIAAPTYFTPVYTDSFETHPTWSMFEEIVGGNLCYGSGIGSVIRSTDVAFDGSSSLLVWANLARSIKSNHVIAGKQVSDFRQPGIWRYVTHAYIDPSTANSGQTGPEISMQNTHYTPATGFRTSTAGIQYVANTAAPNYNNWNVWHETSPGSAGWQAFMTQTLSAGTWYTLTLEADYDNNTYRSFALEGNALNLTYDLSAHHIAEESKGFTNEALVITLEAENRWNTCGAAGIFDYKVYYDMIILLQDQEIFLPVIMK